MSKLKITVIAGLLALGLMPNQALADVKISLRIQGGWAYISAGDVNPGTQAFFDWARANWPASEGEYRAVHNGYEFGGDIIFELNRTFGIGIGGGYMKASGASRMDFWIPDWAVSGSVRTEPKLSAIPIRLGLFLNFPLTRKINFTANFGASYYFQARYSANWVYSYEPNYYYIYARITTLAEKKGVPLGFNGGLGFEYKLTDKVFLCIDAKGRYARFRGLEGTSELSSDVIDPFSERGKLYYESVPMLSGEPRLILVQSDPPPGPGGEARLATVDFGGLSLQAGIRVRF